MVRSTGRSPRTAARRLAASTDSENLYPKLNFWFPIVLFAGICLLPLDLQAVLAGR